jgi:hypothetical protein
MGWISCREALKHWVEPREIPVKLALAHKPQSATPASRLEIYWERYANDAPENRRAATSLFFFPRYQPRQAFGQRAGMSEGHLNEVRSRSQRVPRTWDRVRKSTEQESGDQFSFRISVPQKALGNLLNCERFLIEGEARWFRFTRADCVKLNRFSSGPLV